MDCSFVFAVTGDIEVEVVDDGVMVCIPTGGQRICLAMSRHRALTSAHHALRAINDAEMAQRSVVAQLPRRKRRA